MNYWIAPSFEYNKRSNNIMTDNLIKDVCEEYGIEMDDLFSKSRYRILVEPRQVLFYILHKKLNIPCQKVGKMFFKNHATILHGANQIKNFMEFDKPLRNRVNKIIVRNDFSLLFKDIKTTTDINYKKNKQKNK
jgi:chromosomal replication initiation ATPase DnaA